MFVVNESSSRYEMRELAIPTPNVKHKFGFSWQLEHAMHYLEPQGFAQHNRGNQTQESYSIYENYQTSKKM